MESSHRSLIATAPRRPRPAGAGLRRLAATLASLAAAFVLAWPHPALAQSGGRSGTGAAGEAKSTLGSLRYSDFQLGASSCGVGGFSVDATVSTDIVGPFSQSGRTLLNGAPYDTYTLPDDVGPFVDSTNFSRTFSPPPPASPTYEFVFLTSVVRNGFEIGVSRTTITCTDGILSATNRWESLFEPIPAGGPATLALLAAALAFAGGARLRRSRAR